MIDVAERRPHDLHVVAEVNGVSAAKLTLGIEHCLSANAAPIPSASI